MKLKSNKCVMVIDEALPLGMIANTAGIMGIIQIPVPVLKAGREKIKEMRQRLYQPEFASLIVVDFSDVAQSCNIYDDYIEKAAAVEESSFAYFGIGICGEKKLVNKLTGSLPLLR